MPGSLVRRLIVTAAFSWLAARLALGMLGTVTLSYLGTAALAVLVLLLGWLDLRRNSEVILYANLAVSPVHISAVLVTAALILEFVVGGVLSAVLPTSAQELSP